MESKPEPIEFDSDYLFLANNKNVIQKINNEKLLFSDAIIKINRMGWSQKRNIVITNKAVYNFKKLGKMRIIIIFFHKLFTF